MKRHFFYGLEAPELGWVPAPRYLLRRDRVLHYLGQGQGRSLLDIGCGAGALLGDLAERGFNCSGLETSPKAQEVAKNLHKANPKVLIRSEAEQGWSGSFDVILAMEVLEHIEDDYGALHQWRKWLKPGGLFIASVPCHMSKWTALDEFSGHVRRYEYDELASLINSAQLTVLAQENYGFPLIQAITGPRTRHYAAELKKRNSPGKSNLAQNTAESGIDRRGLDGMYSFCKSPPGLIIMVIAMQVQKLFLHSDLGDGYLVVARAQ